MEIKILVVDDEDTVRDLIAEYLRRTGYTIDVADGVNSAKELINTTKYDIIITDKNMPGLDGNDEGGMDLLLYARKQQPTAEIIMMTGYSTIETAIEAMRIGAFDYIMKPFPHEALKELIDRVMEYKSFINPETIHNYKTLHNEILSLIENKDSLTDDELHNMLKTLDKKIDRFFKAQKERERIIIRQKEALGKIAGFAEQLKDAVTEADNSYVLVGKICEETNKRI
ncbi:MAG: response regulator [Deltaproteobacteria bacterium]|nr:response regulator [Deltaproteobacteria bacterium]